MKIGSKALKLLIFAILLFSCGHASSEIYVIENDVLVAEFDASDGGLNITDLRTGQQYLSVNTDQSADNYNVEVVAHSASQLTARVNTNSQSYSVHWSFDDTDTLKCHIHSDLHQELSDPGFAYPLPMVMDTKESYLVVPEFGGFLYNTNGSDMPQRLRDRLFYKMYKHGQAMMAMVGLTNLKEGLVYVFDTPADSAFRLDTYDKNGSGKSYVPAAVWRPEMGRWGYSRKVLIHISSQGSFVPLAKYYRNWLIKNGNYKSLREKAQERPNVDRLIGAPHVWLTSIQMTRSTDFLEELKENGIEKFMIKGQTFTDDPAYREKGSMVEYRYPEHDQFLTRARDYGYLVAKYMTYSSIRPFTVGDPYTSLYWNFSMLRENNYLPDSAIMNKDGTRMTGWMNQGARVCEHYGMDELVPEHMNYYKEYFLRHDAMFFDVEGAFEHHECYDPNHPMTRRMNVEARKERALYFRNFNPSWLISTEDGAADYMIQHYDWIEGPPTAEFYADWESKRKNTQSPYYMGGWGRDEDRNPPALWKPCLADPLMKEHSLNPKKRIPLYELVHGDQVVTVCRWEYVNNKMTDVWRLKDLRCMLWGIAPAYGFTPEHWVEQKKQIIDSIKMVCPWIEKVGYDEMVNFEYLTEGKMVQKSTFSSGRSIIVNFGKKPFNYGSNFIKPMDFYIVE